MFARLQNARCMSEGCVPGRPGVHNGAAGAILSVGLLRRLDYTTFLRCAACGGAVSAGVRQCSKHRSLAVQSVQTIRLAYAAGVCCESAHNPDICCTVNCTPGHLHAMPHLP